MGVMLEESGKTRLEKTCQPGARRLFSNGYEFRTDSAGPPNPQGVRPFRQRPSCEGCGASGCRGRGWSCARGWVPQQGFRRLKHRREQPNPCRRRDPYRDTGAVQRAARVATSRTAVVPRTMRRSRIPPTKAAEVATRRVRGPAIARSPVAIDLTEFLSIFNTNAARSLVVDPLLTAGSRRQRQRALHGKQNDHRREPSRRNTGGRAEREPRRGV